MRDSLGGGSSSAGEELTQLETPIDLLDSRLTSLPHTLRILKPETSMSSRWDPFASICLVALVLGTAASKLSAQGTSQSIPEALTRPMEFRGYPALRFAARQPDSLIVRHASISTRHVYFSMPQPAGDVRHKSPFLAWFLSFLVPGGGQGYNGQWGKAAAFFGGAVVGVVVANQETCNSSSICTGPGFWLLLASSVGSQIDAPITAAAINRKAKGEALWLPRTTVTVARIYF